MHHVMKVIAHIENDFPSKFGLPHQSGWIPELTARVVFEPEYRNPDAFRGIEDWSHLWLIWEFSKAVRDDWSPTVRPPRLGGNTRMGVFATRSPFRPNAIGLSSVKLLKVDWDCADGPALIVGGADLMDGTPIYDVKPYIPMDSHPEASGGFTTTAEFHKLQVKFPEELYLQIAEEKRLPLYKVLENDPRPRYQNDPTRVYGMRFADYDVHFRVEEDRLTVCAVEKVEES